MVEELLELSRIESGQVPLRLNPVIPYAVISPAVERLRAQAVRGQLTLELNVSRDLPLVLVDAGRIHQVVTNIVHNAIKFTPHEGHIMVSASADATKVTVAVTDTGSGIAPGDLTRIFERFYKVDRSRAVGGTGLGLAIAKHIVQAHGGTIWAVSQEGKGSTFFFTMPRAEPEVHIEPLAGMVNGEANQSLAPSIPPNLSLKSTGSSTRYG
jgi:two-component system phosphate regulon sensor histidine kinase PhoR